MFEYTPHTIPSTIIVVGCGGTGSRLVPQLAQFIKTCTWVVDPKLILIDDDVVEEKNLKRQNFIPPDVGRPKAVVLAERYSRGYGLNIIPRVVKVDGRDFRPHLTNPDGSELPGLYNCMVIMCVDSAEARRQILKSFFRFTTRDSQVFFIDSGNEDSFGQVNFFHSATFTLLKQDVAAIDNLPPLIPVKGNLQFIPMDWKHYKNLKDNDTGASCADLDQTLAINSLMASMIMGVVQNYYYRKPMDFYRVNLSLTGGCSTDLLTVRNFKQLNLCPEEDTVDNLQFLRERCVYNHYASTAINSLSFNLAKLYSQDDEIKKIVLRATERETNPYTVTKISQVNYINERRLLVSAMLKDYDEENHNFNVRNPGLTLEDVQRIYGGQHTDEYGDPIEEVVQAQAAENRDRDEDIEFDEVEGD